MLTSQALEGWRRRLGPVGVWLPPLVMLGGVRAPEVGAELEAMGYGSLWVGGGFAKPSHLMPLAEVLAGTNSLVVATGILNVWAWNAADLRQSLEPLDRGFPERFVLGLGVSHREVVEPSGTQYRRPLDVMSSFLAELDAATGPDMSSERGSRPARPGGIRILAALGPGMLELSRARASGAHPYFVTTEHTARSRELLGPEPLLLPELAVVAEEDPDIARAEAREYMAIYLSLENYVRNLRRLGFGDDDLAEGGSDRLVDAVVAWGGPEAIASRVRAHIEAGADHVLVQPAGRRHRLQVLEELSKVLVPGG